MGETPPPDVIMCQKKMEKKDGHKILFTCFQKYEIDINKEKLAFTIARFHHKLFLPAEYVAIIPQLVEAVQDTGSCASLRSISLYKHERLNNAVLGLGSLSYDEGNLPIILDNDTVPAVLPLLNEFTSYKTAYYTTILMNNLSGIESPEYKKKIVDANVFPQYCGFLKFLSFVIIHPPPKELQQPSPNASASNAENSMIDLSSAISSTISVNTLNSVSYAKSPISMRIAAYINACSMFEFLLGEPDAYIANKFATSGIPEVLLTFLADYLIPLLISRELIDKQLELIEVLVGALNNLAMNGALGNGENKYKEPFEKVKGKDILLRLFTVISENFPEPIPKMEEVKKTTTTLIGCLLRHTSPKPAKQYGPVLSYMSRLIKEGRWEKEIAWTSLIDAEKILREWEQSKGGK